MTVLLIITWLQLLVLWRILVNTIGWEEANKMGHNPEELVSDHIELSKAMLEDIKGLTRKENLDSNHKPGCTSFKWCMLAYPASSKAQSHRNESVNNELITSRHFTKQWPPSSVSPWTQNHQSIYTSHIYTMHLPYPLPLYRLSISSFISLLILVIVPLPP